MYKVFINDRSVNEFKTVDEAYDFALSIEQGNTTEKFNSETDNVTFEGNGCTMTTAEYNEDLKDEYLED